MQTFYSKTLTLPAAPQNQWGGYDVAGVDLTAEVEAAATSAGLAPLDPWLIRVDYGDGRGFVFDGDHIEPPPGFECPVGSPQRAAGWRLAMHHYGWTMAAAYGGGQGPAYGFAQGADCQRPPFWGACNMTPQPVTIAFAVAVDTP